MLLYNVVKKIGKDLILLVLATIVSTLLVWLPFAFSLGKGMLTVFANYDGPNYIIILLIFLAILY